MISKTKGQLEAEISNALIQVEKEHFGRGPKESRTFIIQDMILVRLKGVLTPAEENLACQGDEGARLIKDIRMRLIESSRPLLEHIIEEKTGQKVDSLFTDISSATGERIFVFTLNNNLEELLLRKN